MLSKKTLGKELATLKPISTPRLELEQYSTPSHIAEEILWTAYMQGDIQGKHVVDLGCGSGMLGIGALFLEAAHVTFLDIDENVIADLNENLNAFTYENHTIHACAIDATAITADTVIMNPPFGAQARNADTAFLDAARGIAPIIYSIHNANSDTYLRAYAQKHSWDYAQIANLRFPIPRTFAHHTKRVEHHDIIIIRMRNPYKE